MTTRYAERTFYIGRRWFRVYLGGTSRPARFRAWHDVGNNGARRRGMYLRLSGEQVIGYQRATPIR